MGNFGDRKSTLATACGAKEALAIVTENAAEDPTYSASTHESKSDGSIPTDGRGRRVQGGLDRHQPEISDTDVDVELEGGVIVVGVGVCGVSAMRAMAETGAKVVVFERCNMSQARSGRYAVIGSKLMADNWDCGNEECKQGVLSA